MGSDMRQYSGHSYQMGFQRRTEGLQCNNIPLQFTRFARSWLPGLGIHNYEYEPSERKDEPTIASAHPYDNYAPLPRPPRPRGGPRMPPRPVRYIRQRTVMGNNNKKDPTSLRGTTSCSEIMNQHMGKEMK